MKKIRKLFIANRGEILRRIALTAKRMGIETASLKAQAYEPQYLDGLVDSYAQASLDTPQTYLNGDQVLAWAKELGCDSVHPGFGFLSENAQFAQKVMDAGLIWVGPGVEAMEAMANKGKARDIAKAHQVPITWGLDGFTLVSETDKAQLKTKTLKAPYPLLIKASMGGGGKGMRIVNKESELFSMVDRASSEAMNSFGDPSVILEQYIPKARHIEVQILGDGHGNVACLGERDCSLQRRHQKIVEECPAFFLPETTRRKIHESARKLARAVGYVSAGTVEFLLVWDESTKNLEDIPFYFLEMNTRLQVEHPVTEEVFGLDLVEWQLRIAQGEPISQGVLNSKPRGHSIEVRLYAEDPLNQFFPMPSEVDCFEPFIMPGIRWEVGLDRFDQISGSFDPMIAKIIATGDSRENAVSRLMLALEKTKLACLAHNKNFVMYLFQSTVFKDKPVTTGWLTSDYKELCEGYRQVREAVEAETTEIQKELARIFHQHEMPHSPVQKTIQQIFTPRAGEDAVLIDKSLCEWQSRSEHSYESGRVLLANGRVVSFVLRVGKLGTQLVFFSKGFDFAMSFEKDSASTKSSEKIFQGPQTLCSQTPGKVIHLGVAKGDSVKEGMTLIILESMKMEFELKAACDGVVTEIFVEKGRQVLAGERLMIVLKM